MSKINQIEKTLIEMDATKFHKLVDNYLNKKYGYIIQSNGTKLGEDKSTTGTPDSFAILDNGQYLFMEYTTRETGILEKLLEDLDKCFNESKTGIAVSQIEKIILACNRNLKLSDIETLQNRCKEHRVNQCEILTNSMMSIDINNNYAKVAKDFLNIEIDTNQILDYDDFIKTYDDSSRYTTKLNNQFKFREDEKKQFYELLDSNQILFITGKAGVGKTKFALEECQSYAKNNQYIFKAIFNKSVDLFDDIKAYFGDDKKYLILIDDINRVYQVLDYILNYHKHKINNHQIKIVATVRDYAQKATFDKIPTLISKAEIELKPFDEKEITSLVEDIYQIKNPDYHEQIWRVSQGNPRLALMAARVAKETKSLKSIYDATKIYDEYFKSVKDDIDILNNHNQVVSLTVISFFRAVDKSHDEQMQLIEKVFSISSKDFWEQVVKLNRLEIVDLYQNEVVKVSDQILSTYLFYKIVFVEKQINFYLLLDNFFPKYKQRFIDTLNPIIETFNHDTIKEVLQSSIDNLWSKYYNDKTNLLEAIRLFWFMKKTDTLVYVNDKIEKVQQQVVDVDSLDFWKDKSSYLNNEILEILSFFGNDNENISSAIELIIKYLEKEPLQLSATISILTKNFTYKKDSHHYEYSKEKHLIDTLWNFTQNGENILITKLFIRVSSELLKTEFQDTLVKKNKNTIQTIHYKPAQTDELKELRKTVLDRVFSLYDKKNYKDDIFTLISIYPKGISIHIGITEIEQWDSEQILNFMQTTFDITNYEECSIMQHFLDFLDNRKMEYQQEIRNIFNHKDYVIEKVLLLDKVSIALEKEEEKHDRKAIEEELKGRLWSFFKEYKFKDWKYLLNLSIRINDRIRTNNIEYALSELVIYNQKLYIEVIKESLKSGNKLSLDINVFHLIETLGKEEAYKLINQYDCQNKDASLLNFFYLLSQEQIGEYEVKQLLDFYRSTQSILNIPSSDFIEKYMHIKPTIFQEIVDIVYKRIKNEEESFISLLSGIFNPNTNIYKNLEMYFENNIDLLKELYFLHTANHEYDRDYDYTIFNKILTMDDLFIEDYIYHHYDKQGFSSSNHSVNREFSIIWEREDYERIIFRLVETFFKIYQKNHYIDSKELKSFFEDKEIGEEKVNTTIKKLIQKYATDEERSKFIFKFIDEYPYEQKKSGYHIF